MDYSDIYTQMYSICDICTVMKKAISYIEQSRYACQSSVFVTRIDVIYFKYKHAKYFKIYIKLT